MRRAQKGGAGDEAIGRSRGGLSTKIHAAVDALGYPLRLILTPGQWHESGQIDALIDGFGFAKLLGDKGYDSDRLRTIIAARGAEAVIPSIGSRSQAIPHDRHVYKDRNLVERFFNKIKHFRRIATRYDKTASSFSAMLSIVATMIWLR